MHQNAKTLPCKEKTLKCMGDTVSPTVTHAQAMSPTLGLTPQLP
jgi:hypothetical protein